MNQWIVYKNISKVIAYVLILLLLLQAYIILNGYYQRNKDNPNFNFWSLQEKYEYNSFYQSPPKELAMVKQQFDLFRNSGLFLFLICILVEFCRYKEDPEKWKLKLKNDKYINWFEKKFGNKLRKFTNELEE